MKKKTKKRQRPYVPNSARAICDGKFAVYIDSRRFIKKFRSGEIIDGKTA